MDTIAVVAQDNPAIVLGAVLQRIVRKTSSNYGFATQYLRDLFLGVFFRHFVVYTDKYYSVFIKSKHVNISELVVCTGDASGPSIYRHRREQRNK